MTTKPVHEDLKHEIRIAARPEVVFAFLVDPEKMIQWKGISAVLDPRPGGLYRVDINGRDVARGEYLEVLPHRRVVFTWGWEGEGVSVKPGQSTVEVTLEPDREGTLVRLRHYGLEGEARKSHAEGWVHYLARLASVAEGRPPGPDPWAEPEEGGG